MQVYLQDVLYNLLKNNYSNLYIIHLHFLHIKNNLYIYQNYNLLKLQHKYKNLLNCYNIQLLRIYF